MMKQTVKQCLLFNSNKTSNTILKLMMNSGAQKGNYCSSLVFAKPATDAFVTNNNNNNASENVVTNPYNEMSSNLNVDWRVGESEIENAKPVMSPAKVTEFYSKNHIPLNHRLFRKYGSEPFTDVKELNNYSVKRSFHPKDLTDATALSVMKFLRVFVHAFFGNRYMHHAVVLETVAAVPGMVGGAWKHFTSLRKMRKEQGHIAELLEEAENERMHLVTWMELCRPTLLERMLVILAQIGFTSFYSMAYMLNPRFCHRLVGYLEEEAVNAYSEFLEAIDRGEIKNVPAPDFAIKYWNLAPNSTLRDVVTCVRSDECMHRDYNHQLSSKYQDGIIA
ncbi:hypothetical protein ABK040_003531 [Willaertia magna]